MDNVRKWTKPALILTALFVLTRILPGRAVDPWNIFIPKKMATMVFALTLIQFAGSVILDRLGSRVGAILTGFLGGLVSSTAVTASLSKRSKLHPANSEVTSEVLTFLAATIAMHVEGMAILLFGTEDVHPSILILFFGPVAVASVLVLINAKKHSKKVPGSEKGRFDLLPILTLSAFIIAILAVSKFLQNIFGRSGLLVLTFLVSLFEIHGSFIANIQLHDSGAFDVRMLGNLAALSIGASYLSKLFLVYTIGSTELKIQTRKCTFYLALSLILSWFVFGFLS